MQFTGTRTLEAPVKAVWRTLRDPEILEQIIPNCTRIERQPRHHVDGDGDFALGFEIGRPDEQTGAEPIIGWLEVDRVMHHRHMGVMLTLNDALTFLRADGTITLHEREHGQRTDLRYTFEVRFPGLRGVGWSANAHTRAEAIISAMLNTLAVKATALVAVTAGNEAANGHPRILLENERGHVVLLPAVEVPAPTQSMLRRVLRAAGRRETRQQRSIALLVLASLAGIVGIAFLWQWYRVLTKSNQTGDK